MLDRDAVELLKHTFPCMSKSVYSMAKRPDKYGVELTRLAQNIIGVNERKSDKRRKPYRITFRLTQEQFEQFELARGGDTRQDFCEAIVKEALQL